jgi:hypothetical protein
VLRKYKEISVQNLSFVDMKSGVISRILVWRPIQGRNLTKSFAANKDVLFLTLQLLRKWQVPCEGKRDRKYEINFLEREIR